MDSLINNLVGFKSDIKQALINKKKEIDGGTLDPGNNISEYSKIITDELAPEFEFYFTSIGYDGIPKELLDTLQGQLKYNETSNITTLGKSLFVGTNLKEDLYDNRKCIIVFTGSLSGKKVCNSLLNLLEIYTLKDTSIEDFKNINNLKESIIDPYWFFRGTNRVKHIYGILDVENIGYTVNPDGTSISKPGDYFFSSFLGNGNYANTAVAAYLETLYMKNIHRAYNFGNSPLSMASVLYCIKNALYDAEYAEKADGGCYKFTIKGSLYEDDEDAMAAIENALATRAAELSETGLNMEIVFSSN